MTTGPQYSIGRLTGSHENNDDENYLNEAWERGYELVTIYGDKLAVFRKRPAATLLAEEFEDFFDFDDDEKLLYDDDEPVPYYPTAEGGAEPRIAGSDLL